MDNAQHNIRAMNEQTCIVEIKQKSFYAGVIKTHLEEHYLVANVHYFTVAYGLPFLKFSRSNIYRK
jgi:hypothetical protein